MAGVFVCGRACRCRCPHASMQARASWSPGRVADVVQVPETLRGSCANRLVRRDTERLLRKKIAMPPDRSADLADKRRALARPRPQCVAKRTFEKNRLFSASVCKGIFCRADAPAPARRPAPRTPGERGVEWRKEMRAEVLTVKKTVIRFRPADAACRSE